MKKYNPNPPRLEFCREKQMIQKKPGLPAYVKTLIVLFLAAIVVISVAAALYLTV
jgi:hypothetical protein